MWAECSLLGFCTLILILIWSLVFDSPIFQILVFYVHFGGGKTISGWRWDNVWPIFTSWPASALKFWGLSQHNIKHMSSKYSVLGVLSRPFLDYIGTMFVPILYPDQIELYNFKYCINMVLRHMSIECLLFETLPGPCFDHVGTMFGLALLPDQLELCNLEDWIKMV